jgi:hypothetical protein
VTPLPYSPFEANCSPPWAGGGGSEAHAAIMELRIMIRRYFIIFPFSILRAQGASVV